MSTYLSLHECIYQYIYIAPPMSEKTTEMFGTINATSSVEPEMSRVSPQCLALRRRAPQSGKRSASRV